jgi:hypothetical protein
MIIVLVTEFYTIKIKLKLIFKIYFILMLDKRMEEVILLKISKITVVKQR